MTEHSEPGAPLLDLRATAKHRGGSWDQSRLRQLQGRAHRRSGQRPSGGHGELPGRTRQRETRCCLPSRAAQGDLDCDRMLIPSQTSLATIGYHRVESLDVLREMHGMRTHSGAPGLHPPQLAGAPGRRPSRLLHEPTPDAGRPAGVASVAVAVKTRSAASGTPQPAADAASGALGATPNRMSTFIAPPTTFSRSARLRPRSLGSTSLRTAICAPRSAFRALAILL